MESGFRELHDANCNKHSQHPQRLDIAIGGGGTDGSTIAQSGDKRTQTKPVVCGRARRRMTDLCVMVGAAWRFIDFFTANIRNSNTRRAYARACATFFAWCDERVLSPTSIGPFDVSTA